MTGRTRTLTSHRPRRGDLGGSYTPVADGPRPPTLTWGTVVLKALISNPSFRISRLLIHQRLPLAAPAQAAHHSVKVAVVWKCDAITPTPTVQDR